MPTFHCCLLFLRTTSKRSIFFKLFAVVFEYFRGLLYYESLLGNFFWFLICRKKNYFVASKMLNVPSKLFFSCRKVIKLRCIFSIRKNVIRTNVFSCSKIIKLFTILFQRKCVRKVLIFSCQLQYTTFLIIERKKN